MSDERREESFADQIATIVRLSAELKGRWVIQKCKFDEWRGITLNLLMPYDPVHETWAPVCGVTTYATSGDAVDAMQNLQAQAPDVPMRVAPVDEDILATLLHPKTSEEKERYGRYPDWGELLKQFPDHFGAGTPDQHRRFGRTISASW